MIVSEVAKKILSDKNISQERAKDVILSLINSYLSSKLKDCKFIEKEFEIHIYECKCVYGITGNIVYKSNVIPIDIIGKSHSIYEIYSNIINNISKKLDYIL